MGKKQITKPKLSMLYIYSPTELKIIEKIRSESWKVTTKTGAITEALHSWENLEATRNELKEVKKQFSELMERIRSAQNGYKALSNLLIES